MDSEQTERHRFINVENKLVVARGKGDGGMGKIGERGTVSSYKKISHGDEKYSVGSIVDNSVITLCGERQ